MIKETKLKYSGLCLGLLLSFTLSAATTTQLALTYQITGISDPAHSNALQRLRDIQTRHNKNLSKDSIAKLYQAASKEIKLALKPFGYFKAKVHGHLTHQGNQWIANYQVDPGPIVTLAAVEILLTGPGATDSPLQKFLANYPLKQGDQLNTKLYEKAKQQFFEISQTQGYLKAQVAESEIQVDVQHNTAYIRIHFETGPRYYFGPVHFQTKILRQNFLQRYVSFKQGQPYSTVALLKLQEDLSGSPYFNQVLINPQRDLAQDNQVPITVQLTPRPAQRFDFGLGYGTDTGPRGSLGVQLRRLTDTGQRFTTDLKTSKVSNTLLANYIFPGRHPNTDEYRLFAGIGSDMRGQGASNTKQIGASYLSNVSNWRQTIKLTYQLESFRILPNQNNQDSQLIMPSMSWSKVRSDDLLFPQNGYSAQLTIRTAVDHWISDTRFIQGRFQYKWIHSYGRNNRILLRGDVGYTVADNSDSLPLSIRFYSGGSRNVRGYRYQALGPGRYLTEASAEYQHRIKGNWYGAVFYDIGNAYNNFNDGLKRGVGIGLVWASPIGPLNLSLAKALDNQGQPLMLQFSMGPDL